jgi:fatty acid/phospholipid biosynthesis enzyme
MNDLSAAELRAKLQSGLTDAGYLLTDDGTHRLPNITDGKYHTASIEGLSHPVLVAHANYATSRFVRTFNVISETALRRALAELSKEIKPSYMAH